ncbi:MAG: hypothetical protein PHQ43_11510 [Dehalococcoidales bacterium]|nr:hypothetical protein [Dehalococcoidales bacterium]
MPNGNRNRGKQQGSEQPEGEAFRTYIQERLRIRLADAVDAVLEPGLSTGELVRRAQALREVGRLGQEAVSRAALREEAAREAIRRTSTEAQTERRLLLAIAFLRRI